MIARSVRRCLPMWVSASRMRRDGGVLCADDIFTI